MKVEVTKRDNRFVYLQCADGMLLLRGCEFNGRTWRVRVDTWPAVKEDLHAAGYDITGDKDEGQRAGLRVVRR